MSPNASGTTPRIDPARVAAYSSAMGIHVLAALLLMIPITASTLRKSTVADRQPDRTLVDIIPREVEPPPPPPPPARVQVRPDRTPRVQPVATPAPVLLPAPIDSGPVEPLMPTLPDPGPPLEAGTGTQAPSALAVLYGPHPQYPIEALRKNVEGIVLLLVEVDDSGLVTDITLRRSSGNGALDRAARDAVRRWRFAPPTDGGRALRARVELPIRFQVNTG